MVSIPKLSVFQKGIIAMLIDCEGTIHISKRHYKKKNKIYLLAEIVVGNTCLPLLDKAQRIIGGSLREIKPCRTTRPNHKKMYRLERRDMHILHALLKSLLPHLIAKKHQAKLMIEYCHNRLQVGKTWAKAYTDRDFQIYEEMKQLNKRGK